MGISRAADRNGCVWCHFPVYHRYLGVGDIRSPDDNTNTNANNDNSNDYTDRTVTGTPTSTVTTTPTGTQILPLIASPTGIIYSSYVLPVPGNGPDMSTVYQIYTTVTNPNNVAVPIDLTMTEDPVAPSPLLGEQYQANQPISADNTNVIQAYSSHTFTFSYIHKWDWTDTITGPIHWISRKHHKSA